MALPKEYQEVEYIESTATSPWSASSSWQYIDSLVTINKDIKIEIDIQFTSTATQSRLFGCGYDSGSSWITFEAYINSSTQWARATANWTWNWQTTNVSANTNRNKFVLDNSRYIIYNSSWAEVYNATNSATITNSDTWTIPLLARLSKTENKICQHSSAKLYWCKIWDNDVLVRDFVPCYRKSDNEIWLYDLANNQFYTNAWTGVFIKWARVLPDCRIKRIYIGTDLIWPARWEWYYSDKNREEYQSLVNSIGSIQFIDTGKRFRFKNWVYIWDRTALDFDWTTMRTINLDTLTIASFKSSTISGKVRYFWDNRILTRMWIADFEWNMITAFSTTYNSITPWLPWVVWANSWYDIYKWVVDWDNVTFTKVWTWLTDQSVWWMFYWRLWAYLINYHDNSWSGNSSYINPESWAITNFWAWSSSNWRIWISVSWPDWKLYRKCRRNIWWWLMQKIWTWNEWIVWSSLSTNRNDYWNRWWKFLWNIVSWWMNSSNWTWNWYWSNNYFIATDWTLTKVQDNAFAYDTNIEAQNWFIDENGRLYPVTSWWWSWVILKTDKTFTNLSWWNPYLWR